jgi:hypothetical protein
VTDVTTSNGIAGQGLVRAHRRERSLKGQATTLDARAERLVKHVRTELDGIRETLDLIGAGQDEMLEVTPASVAENPTVAATLAPVVLVRSMITAHARQQDLEQQLAELTAQFVATKHELTTMREQHAGQGGRVATLDQVIAALHENLQDLRAERKNWLGPGPDVPALPPGDEAD